MSKPIYEFDYVTYSDDASPSALQGSTYWYDTETTAGGDPVYYDTSDTYAYWFDATVPVVTLIADVGTLPTDYFIEGATPGELDGTGAWTGTVHVNANTISDAWYRAETSAFESLRAFVGATEGSDCFRGFLPVMGDSDDDKLVNVWQFTSGDSDEFEIDRVKGENPNWCSLRADARVESLWRTREEAMKFAGAVVAWLKSTDNLMETGNVTWCTLSDMPDEPEIYRTDGPNRARYWRQTVDLELVYKTESNYN